MAADRPLTIMGPHLWCHRHLSPLEPDWPRGYLIAMLGLFQEAASDPRMAVLTEGRVEAIQRVMNDVAPVCCWLPEGIAEAIIQSGLDGKPYWNPAWPPEMRPKGESDGR